MSGLHLAVHGPPEQLTRITGDATPGSYDASSGFDGLGSGPRFGQGLPPKPLHSKADSGPAVSSAPAHAWPSVTVTAGKLPAHVPPKYPKVGSLSPGPGAYPTLRDFDPYGRKQGHATMGTLPAAPRANVPPPAATPDPRLQLVRARKSSWVPSTRSKSVTHTSSTPGPGAYKPCDSSFCVCTNCEGIASGKTFGTRPPVYTGNAKKPALPGPPHYHVECTTLGAAAAPCDEESIEARSYPLEGLPDAMTGRQ